MEESKILSCAWMWSEGSGEKYVFSKEALLDFARELLSLSQQTAPQDDCEWCAGVGHDPFGEVCEHCQSAPQPEQSGLNDDRKEAAMQKAFELGGLEDGSYHLETDELELVIRAALSAQGGE